MFLGNFHVYGLDELVLGLGGQGSRVSRCTGQSAGQLGIFETIPNILPIEAQGNGRAIRVQAMKKSFKSLSEAGEVSVFVGVEQPANFGDVGGLDRVGVDLLQFFIHFMPKAEVKILWGESYPIQTLRCMVSVICWDQKPWKYLLTP